jgi:hypothetical protein
MVSLQRIIALLMAAAMVFVLLVPLAVQRHAYTLVFIVVGIFVVYLGVNAWIWLRMRS